MMMMSPAARADFFPGAIATGVAAGDQKK